MLLLFINISRTRLITNSVKTPWPQGNWVGSSGCGKLKQIILSNNALDNLNAFHRLFIHICFVFTQSTIVIPILYGRGFRSFV